MSVFVLEQDKKGGMNVMRSWVNEMMTSAIDQSAPTAYELTQIYAKSNIAFRASNKRGDAVASVPMQILDSAKSPLPEDDPLVKALQRQMRDNMRRSEITLCWFGYNMLAKRRAYNGSVYRMQWVNPTMYTRDIRPDGLKGFRVNAKREQIPENYIKKSDAIFHHEFDFNDDFGGVAAAHVALNWTEYGLEMNQTQRAFMQNGGAPQWVVTADSSGAPNAIPQEADATALTKLIKNLFVGSGNRGRTLVQRAAWKWIQLSTDWDKIKFSDQYKDVYQAVAIAFDMPLEMIISDSSTYAEAKIMIYEWGWNWLVPRVNWYAEAYTEQLLQDPVIVRRYGSGLTVAPDLDEVQILQEDGNLKIDKINKQVTGGYRDLYTAAIETGVKEPPEILKGKYMWNGVPTPITVIDTLWQAKLPAPAPAPTTPEVIPGHLAPAQPPAQAPEQQSALPAQTGGKSVALMLSLANNPDLVALQGMTRRYVGETSVEWNTPDTFHVTLVVMPNATDEQIAMLKTEFENMDVPEMTFKVGSLGTFDNLGEHAVHFKLRNNQTLNDFQEQCYQKAVDLGIPTSGYSLPDGYNPHITMGYAKDKVPSKAFYSGLAVKPTELHMGVEKDIVAKKPIGEPKPPPEPPKSAKTNFLSDEMFSELKVAARKGAGFVVDKLPQATVTYITSLKALGYEQDVVLESAKSFTSRVIAAKAVSATQRDFEREFDALMEAARNDETTRRQASAKLRSLISQYVDRAFYDGLIDGGVDELAVTAEDKDTLAKVKSDQSAYVTGFLDNLFKGDGISDDQAVYKASMWWSGSIYPAYLAGLESAAADGLFEFKLGKTETHCPSCLYLDGQKHRFSEFKASGWLPRSQKLACKGLLCDCDLIPATGKARGSLDNVPSAARSHVHEEGIPNPPSELEPVV